MSDLEVASYVLSGWITGLVLGYVVWAPVTPFYRAFIDGLSLKFIWGRFIK